MAEENKTVLSSAQVDEALETLEGWSRSEAVLARNFVFQDFEAITSFLNHLVRAITAQNHHPDFSLNLFGCDSPKLASSRFRVIFLLIPRSLLRGSLHSYSINTLKTERLQTHTSARNPL